MLIGPQNWAVNVARVRAAIAAAAAQCGRSVDSVTLLAVSKTQPPAAIAAVADCGVADFGENFVQDALPKLDALADRALTWHFIGHVQANKTRAIATHFAWVHGIDRLKIAERLATQRPFHGPPLNVCLEVNVADEEGKAGVSLAELPALALEVARLPRLTLRGLMCVPPEEHDPARQRAWFRRLREARDALREQGLALDTLSMGMSGDFQMAIAEGATIVRIGTALFGPRLRAP